MTDLYHVTRTAPDCWEITAAAHHPDERVRGGVVAVVPDEVALREQLARWGKGERVVRFDERRIP